MINLFEVRIKRWKDKDFTSGEMYICTIEELGTLKQWIEFLEEVYETYDEVSIRKVNKDDSIKIMKQVKQQQEIEQMYEMLQIDDITDFTNLGAQLHSEEYEENENLKIISLNISDKVWEEIENMKEI